MSFTLPTLEELRKITETHPRFFGEYLRVASPEYRVRTKIGLDTFEAKHNLKLPKSFKSVIEAYDFDKFRIGNLWFGSGAAKDYIKYFNWNNLDPVWMLWEGDQAVPLKYQDSVKQLIYIGGGDPYTIMLDTVTGEIGASHEELPPHKRHVIAKDFELFVRASILCELEELNIDIAEPNDICASVKNITQLSSSIAEAVGIDKTNLFWLADELSEAKYREEKIDSKQNLK